MKSNNLMYLKNFSLVEKFLGENHIFVFTFSRDSHFDPYLLFSLLLVPI